MRAYRAPSHPLPAGLDSDNLPSNITQQGRPSYSRRPSSISYSNGSSSLLSGHNRGRSQPKWLVAVTASKQMAALSETAHNERTVLLPLQASLHAQLAAVARAFGLRSAPVMTLAIALGSSLPTALFVEESWAIAWAGLLSSEVGVLGPLAPVDGSLIPRVTLPVAATLVAGIAHRPEPHLPRPLTLTSPKRKTRPSQLALLGRQRLIDTTMRDAQEITVQTSVDAESPEVDDEVTNQFVDCQDGSVTSTLLGLADQHSPWPPTPPSPDRLPSTSLMDRLVFSPSGPISIFTRSFPDAPIQSEFKHVRFSREAGPLIETAQNVRMRTLAECSEPSPVDEVFLCSSSTANLALPCSDIPPHGQSAEIPYPFSLASIYPPVYPHFQLYPALETVVIQSKLAAQPGFHAKQRAAYPISLSAIYPPVYPHFNFYRICGPMISIPAPRKRPAQEIGAKQDLHNVGYPYSLSALYPPLYPHFDLYPSLTQKVARRSVRTPSRADAAVPSVDWADYPSSLTQIYPAVYPYFVLYPVEPPAAIQAPDMVSSAIVPMPRRKLSAARLSPIALLRQQGRDIAGQVLHSPSEHVDRDGSVDVSFFKRKRTPAPIALPGNLTDGPVLSTGHPKLRKPSTSRRSSTPSRLLMLPPLKLEREQPHFLASPSLHLPVPASSSSSFRVSPISPVFAQ